MNDDGRNYILQKIRILVTRIRKTYRRFIINIVKTSVKQIELIPKFQETLDTDMTKT